MAYINGKKVLAIVSGSGGGNGSSIIIDDAMSSVSTNPVQNKVITQYAVGQSARIDAIEAQLENGGSTAKISETTYIDLEPYTYTGTAREMLVEALNQKILEAYNNRPTGAERANIVFYNSGNTQFIFKGDVSFCSNCNYFFLDSNELKGLNYVVLSGLENCDFYGLNLGGVFDGNTLMVSNCSNLQFFNSFFENGQSQAIAIEESTDIYFENCTIAGGSYSKTIIKMKNTATSMQWAMFENCIFNNKSTEGYKVIDATNVTNTKQLVTLVHCFFNDLVDISANSVTKGSAVIKVSALTTL